MARKPSNWITISNSEVFLFGGKVMQRANYPKYLYAEWQDDQVTLHRKEDYTMKQQGIYKVTWGGGGKGKALQARISAKLIVEGAELTDGRYLPISVDEKRIVFGTIPTQTPDKYRRRVESGDAS